MPEENAVMAWNGQATQQSQSTVIQPWDDFILDFWDWEEETYNQDLWAQTSQIDSSSKKETEEFNKSEVEVKQEVKSEVQTTEPVIENEEVKDYWDFDMSLWDEVPSSGTQDSVSVNVENEVKTEPEEQVAESINDNENVSNETTSEESNTVKEVTVEEELEENAVSEPAISDNNEKDNIEDNGVETQDVPVDSEESLDLDSGIQNEPLEVEGNMGELQMIESETPVIEEVPWLSDKEVVEDSDVQMQNNAEEVPVKNEVKEEFEEIAPESEEENDIPQYDFSENEETIDNHSSMEEGGVYDDNNMDNSKEIVGLVVEDVKEDEDNTIEDESVYQNENLSHNDEVQRSEIVDKEPLKNEDNPWGGDFVLDLAGTSSEEDKQEVVATQDEAENDWFLLDWPMETGFTGGNEKSPVVEDQSPVYFEENIENNVNLADNESNTQEQFVSVENAEEQSVKEDKVVEEPSNISFQEGPESVQGVVIENAIPENKDDGVEAEDEFMPQPISQESVTTDVNVEENQTPLNLIDNVKKETEKLIDNTEFNTESGDGQMITNNQIVDNVVLAPEEQKPEDLAASIWVWTPSQGSETQTNQSENLNAVKQSETMEVQSTLSLDQILDTELLSNPNLKDKSTAVPVNTVNSWWFFSNKKMVWIVAWVGLFVLTAFVVVLAFPSSNWERDPNEIVTDDTWSIAYIPEPTVTPEVPDAPIVTGNSIDPTISSGAMSTWEHWAPTGVFFPTVEEEWEGAWVVDPEPYIFVWEDSPEMEPEEPEVEEISIDKIRSDIFSFKWQAEIYYSAGESTADKQLMKYATQMKYLCESYQTRLDEWEWVDIESYTTFKTEVNWIISKINAYMGWWDEPVVIQNLEDNSYFDGKEEILSYIENR